MIDITQNMNNKVADFRACVLEALEQFNDTYTDWESKSGFPFLNLTSREYYLQRFFEERIEEYIREILVNDLLDEMFYYADKNVKFFRLDYDVASKEILTNRRFERLAGFEFIEKQIDRVIGFRYTPLPIGKDARSHLLKLIEENEINEIRIIDWPLAETYDITIEKKGWPEELTIRHDSLEGFFIEYFGAGLYRQFIDYLRETVYELQEYLGVVSIPRLTPPLLFSFRFEVEEVIKKYALVLGQSVFDLNQSPDNAIKADTYHVIDESTKSNKHYSDLENRTVELIQNTSILKTFQEKKLYKALIGRGSFAKCLITSEYLYRNYNSSDQFDFTAIVSGYLKSVEQLMYSIALISLDCIRSDGKYFQIAPKYGDKRITIDFTTANLRENKVDTTIGSLCHFFRINKDTMSIYDQNKETVMDCLFCYADECRNESFHKHNISEWRRVELIRHNTFFIYVLLLGACRLCENIEKIATHLEIATDDKLSRVYYFLVKNNELDYYMSFSDGKTIEICKPREDVYPSFDRYGILKNNCLELQVEHFNGIQEELPYVLHVTEENMPDRIWFYDEKIPSLIHEMEL